MIDPVLKDGVLTLKIFINEVDPLIQYAKDFLILQIRFAQKIAEVSDQALEDVLIDYTMLRTLFNLRVSHVATVRGGSWLYNIPTYLRLFPPDYVKTAKPVGYETMFWALWGQFIGRKGSIRQSTASQFLDCLSRQKTVDGCLQCFPYQVLRPECSVETFYDFYSL